MTDIAILGFGVVGSGVAEVIAMNSEQIKAKTGVELRVKKILDLRDFPSSPFATLVTHDADEVFGDKDIKIAVETIGGARIAYEYTKRALSAGISVVTSNKELVSTHGPELLQIAKDNNCCYLFEAAVGGGIPIIRPLNRCLAGNKIVKIAGIVNGTTNYILSCMKNDGVSYVDALKQAQLNGYAEADPTADVEGIDAQRKLSILSTIALCGKYVSPDEIHTEGISKVTLDDIKFAKTIGCELKLIALFENKGDGAAKVYVAPHYVSTKNLLASVEGVFNAIEVEGNAVGRTLFYGQGAGMLPTASAVVGDIIEVAKEPEGGLMWFSCDEKVTAEYDNIQVTICVRSSEATSTMLTELFKNYTCKTLSDAPDAAILVKGIKHADIDSCMSKVPGGKWFRYLE